MATPVEKIQHVTNREELSLDLLLSQFKGKENVEKFIKLFTDELQLIEDVTYDLLILRTVDKAVGSQLDEIGKRLDTLRTSDNDEVYRNTLRVKALSKRNDGTEDDVVEILKLISADPDVNVYKFEPYGVIATYSNACVPENRLDQLSSIFPVVTDLRLQEFNTSRPFGFASVNNPNPNLDDVIYGPFSSVGSAPDSLVNGSFVSLSYSSTT